MCTTYILNSLAQLYFLILLLYSCVLLHSLPTDSNCLIEKARLDLFLPYNYYICFIFGMGSLICFGVRYSRLTQVLEVWHMMGYIGLCMQRCRYVKYKVNYFLYIICLLFADRVSKNISICRCFPQPSNSTVFGLVQLVTPLLQVQWPNKQAKVPVLVKQCQG